ncbi:unnamed protein product, partial [Phaeothamnion confervicola]
MTPRNSSSAASTSGPCRKGTTRSTTRQVATSPSGFSSSWRRWRRRCGLASRCRFLLDADGGNSAAAAATTEGSANAMGAAQAAADGENGPDVNSMPLLLQSPPRLPRSPPVPADATDAADAADADVAAVAAAAAAGERFLADVLAELGLCDRVAPLLEKGWKKLMGCHGAHFSLQRVFIFTSRREGSWQFKYINLCL